MTHAETIADCCKRFTCISARLEICEKLAWSQHGESGFPPPARGALPSDLRDRRELDLLAASSRRLIAQLIPHPIASPSL
jgi:hypothetical protein